MFGSDSTLSIVIKARDEASAVLKQVQGSVESTGLSMRNIVATAGLVTAGVTAAAGALAAISLPAVKAAADLEQTHIAFETMLGSAQDADAFVKQLIQFAKTTPFTLQGLQDASKELLAFGFTQKEVIPNLKALGDIAAGVGMDKLPNLILAFGQVKAATRLTGMELRQFTEAGVPLLDELSKVTGMSVQEMAGNIGNLKIPFEDVQKALMNLTGEGGRFNDLMVKQSASLSGMFSNLQDAWYIFLAGQGSKLIDFAKKLIEVAIYLVQNVFPAWINAITSLATGFNDLVASIDQNTGLITLLGWAWTQISTTFREQLWPALKQLWDALQPLMPLLQAMAVVFGYALVGAISGAVVVLTGLIKGLTYLISFAVEVGAAITKFIVTPIKALTDTLADAILYVDQLISKLNVLSGLKSIGGSISSGISGVGKLLGFEQGGIVPGPVGTPVPIIAHGQERIIPVGQTGGSGSAVYVTINSPTVRSQSDLDAMKALIEDVMRPILLGAKVVHI